MIWCTQVQSRYTSGTKGANAPHLYYLAFSAYEAMLRTKKSQCFVIRSVMNLCFYPCSDADLVMVVMVCMANAR
jgi:hypothetical protein